MNSAMQFSTLPQYQYELARTYYFLGKRPGRESDLPLLALEVRRNPPSGPLDFGGDMLGPPFWLFEQDEDRPGPEFGRPPEEHGPSFGPPPDSAFGPYGPPSDFSLPFFFPDDIENVLQKAVNILEKLVAEYPAMPDYRHLLALCYREAPFPRFGRRPDSTSPARDKAIKILQKLVEECPDVPDYRYDLCETYAMENDRGPFSPRGKDRPAGRQSRETLEKALAISEELVAEHPNIPDYAASQVFIRLRLADTLWDSDQSGAESNLRKALELQAALVRHYPRTYSYKFGSALIHESLAKLLENAVNWRRRKTCCKLPYPCSKKYCRTIAKRLPSTASSLIIT
jgi:tetratricopeptide (TPR) repeat protein